LTLTGAFLQDGAGAVQTAGDITTTSDNITFQSDVTLTGAIAVSTGGAGTGDIDFNDTLDGGFDLALTAGTGDVGFSAAIGGGADLGAVTLNSAADVTVNDLDAASLTQTAGSGTTTFNGPVATTGAGGIDLNGTAFVISDTLTTTGNGGVSVTNTGQLTLAAGGDLTLTGAFLQDGAGAVQTAGDITTTSDNITFQGNITLTGDVVFDTGAGGGDIHFTNTLNGNQDLILVGGTGDVDWNAGIGGFDALANFMVSGGAITANGKTTVDGTVSITGSDGVSINSDIDPTTVTLSSADDINITAAVTADNAITVDAGTDGTGSVNVNVGGTIGTTAVGSDVAVTSGNSAGDISFSGDVTADDELTVNAVAGAIFQSGGVITGTTLDLDALSGIHDGAGGAVQTSAVSIAADNAGAIDVNIENTQALDTAVTSLTTQGGEITFIQSGGGDVTLSGTISSGINPGTDGGDIFISSASMLTVDGMTDSRAGSGGILTIQGGVLLNVSPELGAGDITMHGNASDIIINAPMIWATEILLTAPRDIIVRSLIQTTSPDADIKLYADFSDDGVGGVRIEPSGKIDSARDIIVSGSDLQATSRVGDSVVIENDGVSEQVQAVRDITIQSGSGAAAKADILIEGLIRSSGTGTLTLSPNDTLYLESNLLTAGGDVYLNNPLELTNDSGIDTGNGDIYFNDTVNGGYDLGISAGNGNILFSGSVGNISVLNNVTMNGAGSVTINDSFISNMFIIANGGTVDLNGPIMTTSDFASAGSRFDNTGGSITAQSGNITIEHADDVTIGGALNSHSGDVNIETSGAIILDNTIQTTAGSIAIDSDEATVITVGGEISTETGDVRIGLNRNGDTRLASHVTTTGGSVTFDNPTVLTGNITINTSDMGGNIAFNGSLDGSFDLSLAAGTGSISFANDIGSQLVLGHLSVDGASEVAVENAINAAQVEISNGGVVDLNGEVIAPEGFSSTGSNFNSTDAPITTVGRDIIINHTGEVVLDGALSSGAGNIEIDSDSQIIITAAGDITTTTGSTNLGAYREGNFVTGGDITTSGGNITFNNGTTLTGDAVIATGDGGGDIIFKDNVNGKHSLSMTAGEGSIMLEKAVGNVDTLNNLRINSTSRLTAHGSIAAENVTILDGGDIDLNGAVTAPEGFYSNGSGFDNTGANITTSDPGITIRDTGNITIGSSLISGEGNIEIETTGTLNIDNTIQTTTGTINLDADEQTTINNSGGITTTTGNVSLGTNRDGAIQTAGDITTSSGNVTFNNATLLIGNIFLTTSDGLGDIVFNNRVDGGYALDTSAGTGNLEFRGRLGSTDKLGDITVHSASEFTADESVYVDSFTLTNGTGDVTFNNTLITEGAVNESGGPINIITNGNIAIAGTINSAGGAVTSGAGQSGGDVTLVSDGGSAIVASIGSSGSDALQGEGGNAGNISLQAAKELTLGGRSEGDYLPVGLIQLQGDLIAAGGKGTNVESEGTGGEIHLGMNGRDSIPSIASIAGNPSSDSIAIQGHSISMGQNEKLTVLGNLTMQTDGGDITVGDLTTQGHMTVDAGELGTIILLRREVGDVRLAASAGGGVARDAGLDFVAGGNMTFINTLELAGIGDRKPQFSVLDINAISAPPKGDQRFIVRQMSEFQDLIGSVLDGIAVGQIRGTVNESDVAAVLADAMSHDRPIVERLRVQKPRRHPLGLSEWKELAAVLEQIGITFRPINQDEILQGWAIYDDYSGTHMLFDSSGAITANRMGPSEILRLAENLSRLLEVPLKKSKIETAIQYDSHQDKAGSNDRNRVANIQEEAVLKQYVLQIILILNMLDQTTAFTSFEKEQLSEQTLQLVKPQEIDIDQFRDIITHF
jgi:hypothetical protein